MRLSRRKLYIHWSKGTYIVAESAQPVIALLSSMKSNRTRWVILHRRDRGLFYVFTRPELEKQLKRNKSDITLQRALALGEQNQSLVFSGKRRPTILYGRSRLSGPPNRTLFFGRERRIVAIGKLSYRRYRISPGVGGGSELVSFSKPPLGEFRAMIRRRNFPGPSIRRPRALRRPSPRPPALRTLPPTRGAYIPVQISYYADDDKQWGIKRGPRPPVAAYKEFKVVRIFYGTDRALKRKTEEGNYFYANKRCTDGRIALGICDVSIPHDHKMGDFDSPCIWKLQFKANPKKHIVLLNTVQRDRQAFFGELRQRVAQDSGRSAFVFIHGYNVSFEDAARRTAQLAYDLKFPGAPILYSWPSRAKVLEYVADTETIQLTKKQLLHFLKDVAAQSGAQVIHLIAHDLLPEI